MLIVKTQRHRYRHDVFRRWELIAALSYLVLMGNGLFERAWSPWHQSCCSKQDKQMQPGLKLSVTPHGNARSLQDLLQVQYWQSNLLLHRKAEAFCPSSPGGCYQGCCSAKRASDCLAALASLDGKPLLSPRLSWQRSYRIFTSFFFQDGVRIILQIVTGISLSSCFYYHPLTMFPFPRSWPEEEAWEHSLATSIQNPVT